MKAGKAYISSLGTTGLLIACSVLLLLVVGTLLAFDRWPSDSPRGSGTVAIGDGEDARPARATVAERRRAHARVVRRRAAARRRAARARVRSTRRAADERAGSAVEDPVVSGLPAPDSAPGGDEAGGGAAGGNGPVTRSEGVPAGGGTRGGGQAAAPLGGAVTPVSPTAGATVGQVGQAVDEALAQTAPAPAP